MKKFVFLAISSLIFSPFVQASEGPVEVFAECSGNLKDGTYATFTLRATAAPTLIQGLLYIGANPVSSYCKKQNAADGSLIMSCTEFRSGDGKLSVLLRSGNQGFVSAQVSIERIYPLQPKVLGTLSCQ